MKIGPSTAASFMNLSHPAELKAWGVGQVGKPRIFGGLREFAAFMKREAFEHPMRVLGAASFATAVMKWSIQREFGDYSKLAPNTEATMDLRSDEGAGGPLWISGALASSIEGVAVPEGDGAVSGVGSASQILVWQEHGYMTAPDSMIPNKIVVPRPAFALGVYEAMPLIQKGILRFVIPGLEWRNMDNTFANFMRPESFMHGAGDVMNIARGQMPHDSGYRPSITF